MELLRTFGVRVAERSRESLRRNSPRVVVTRIHVDTTPEHGGSLAVRYELAHTGGEDRRPVVVTGAREASLQPLAATPAGGKTQGSRASGTIVELAPRESWDGARIHVRTGWPASSTAQPHDCVLAPDELPHILVRQDTGPQPGLTLAESVVGPGKAFDFGGVTREPGVQPGLHNLLSAVLVRSPASVLRGEGASSIVLAGRFRDELSARQEGRLARFLSRVLDFHADMFGVAPGVRLVVSPDQGSPGAGGALLRLRSLHVLGIHGDQDPEDVMLASRLASVWWGTGCRITGRHGRELEAALRAAAGMLWADEVEGVFRAGVLAAWRDRAAGSRLQDRWSAWQHGFRHGLHARMTLLLYDAFKHEPSAREALGALTARYWGSFVPSGEVQAALMSYGLILPSH